LAFLSHILGILQVPISELFSFVTEHGNWSRYAWVLAKCNTCRAIGIEQHMGWHFKVIDSNMHPKSFWESGGPSSLEATAKCKNFTPSVLNENAGTDKCQ
jgi:hypothetical protein